MFRSVTIVNLNLFPGDGRAARVGGTQQEVLGYDTDMKSMIMSPLYRKYATYAREGSSIGRLNGRGRG